MRTSNLLNLLSSCEADSVKAPGAESPPRKRVHRLHGFGEQLAKPARSARCGAQLRYTRVRKVVASATV